jgi:hypothetical protein
MKTLTMFVILAALSIPQSARAQIYAGAGFQGTVLEPTQPNITVTQSSPQIRMGITIQPAVGTPLFAYQVEILVTTSNPATNPNAVVAASTTYTPYNYYSVADIDTSALAPGNYWVSAQLWEAPGITAANFEVE